MPSIINATTTGGVVVSGDNSGSLQLQNSGVTELTVASTGVTVADNLLFNSGYGSAAVAYGCRAWVNFDGTGTPAIRASGNVSSITDNGTGDYTVNFTTAMPDVNYAGLVTAGDYNANGRSAGGYTNATRLAGSYRVYTTNASQNAVLDCDTVYVAVFR
jgi:hypothetical protein